MVRWSLIAADPIGHLCFVAATRVRRSKDRRPWSWMYSGRCTSTLCAITLCVHCAGAPSFSFICWRCDDGIGQLSCACRAGQFGFSARRLTSSSAKTEWTRIVSVLPAGQASVVALYAVRSLTGQLVRQGADRATAVARTCATRLRKSDFNCRHSTHSVNRRVNSVLQTRGSGRAGVWLGIILCDRAASGWSLFAHLPPQTAVWRFLPHNRGSIMNTGRAARRLGRGRVSGCIARTGASRCSEPAAGICR